MPPTEWQPSAATAHSQMFGAQIATLSPAATPDAIMARAARSISAHNSRKVSRTSPSTMPSRSPNSSRARRTTAGIVTGS